MRTKTRVAMALIALLAGCATSPEAVRKEMASWEGSPVKELIASWGVPDKQQTFEGKRYYTWVYQTTQGVVAVPDVSTKSGMGPTRGMGQHMTEGQAYCERVAQVSGDGIVEHVTWEGNSCGGFGKKQ
jgi:outer membrane protein assembly factor BamE (lipoprotein component of BamABCDE complex)